jgi:hypothetical protein
LSLTLIESGENWRLHLTWGEWSSTCNGGKAVWFVLLRLDLTWESIEGLDRRTDISSLNWSKSPSFSFQCRAALIQTSARRLQGLKVFFSSSRLVTPIETEWDGLWWLETALRIGYSIPQKRPDTKVFWLLWNFTLQPSIDFKQHAFTSSLPLQPIRLAF